MLDLEHGSLARRVRRIGWLAHHAVEPGTFEQVEPLPGYAGVVGDRCEVHVRRERERLQELAPLCEREMAHVLSVVLQDVERHEPGWRGLRQFLDLPAARFRAGADAVAQQVELQAFLPDDDEFAVQRGSWWELLGGRDDLREQVAEVLFLAALQNHGVRLSEHDAAEAVPLGLVEQPRGLRHVIAHGLRQHRGDHAICHNV